MENLDFSKTPVTVGANADVFRSLYFCPTLKTNNPRCRRPGAQIELTHYFFTYLGWQYKFVQSPDGYWASKIDGQWVGFMKMLLNESLDMTLPVMMPLLERINTVKYLTAITSHSLPALGINRSLVLDESAFSWWMVFGPIVWGLFFVIWLVRYVFCKEHWLLKYPALYLSLETFNMLFEHLTSNFILQRLIFRSSLPLESLLQAIPAIRKKELTWVTTGNFGRILSVTNGDLAYTGLAEALARNPPKIVSSYKEEFTLLNTNPKYFAADDGFGFYLQVSKRYKNILAVKDIDAMPIPVLALMGKHTTRAFRNSIDAALLYLQDCGLTEALDSKYNDMHLEFQPTISKEVVLRLKHMKELFNLLGAGIFFSFVIFFVAPKIKKVSHRSDTQSRANLISNSG